MLLTVFGFEKDAVAFNAVNPFVAIETLGFPNMLLHALN